MTRGERTLAAVERQMQEKSNEIQAVWDAQAEEDREPSQDELKKVDGLVKDINDLKEQRKDAERQVALERDVVEAGKQIGPVQTPQVHGQEPRVTMDRQDRMMKDLGQVFIESDGFKHVSDLIKSSERVPQFSTPPVSMEAKGTLLEGAGAPGSGSGGGLVAVPQVVGGVVDTLFQRLTVSDVLGSGQTSGNSLRYIIEGTATSGAGGVAEAGLKPESTLGLGTKDEPVKKIATILPVSEEMLEDAPQVRSYINSRLVLFVRIEEERQLVRGTSGGNEVQGLLTSRNVPVYAGGTAAGNKAIQLFKAINGTRGSSFTEPEFVLLHPSDYQDVRLLADSSGNLFGGGPFFGPYGGPQGPAPIGQGQLTGGGEQVWGKRVIITTATGAGTAVIGSSAAAIVWRRGGISVDASNSHSDYFQRNLVALRAEERLALAVYRPGAFCEVRLS